MGSKTKAIEEPTVSNDGHPDAQAAIRAFRDRADLPLTYRDRTPNPYSSDDESLIDIYVDHDGYEYWCHADTGELVQMGPHPDSHSAALQNEPAERLEIPRLRETALALAERAVKGFMTFRESLHPLEDNRRGRVYFFRWDDFQAPVAETDMPPFLQVALYADGTVAAFTNTLSRSA